MNIGIHLYVFNSIQRIKRHTLCREGILPFHEQMIWGDHDVREFTVYSLHGYYITINIDAR